MVTKKILMIEDEDDIVFSFSESLPMLLPMPVEFLHAKFAEEGLEIAKKEKPDLVMLDLKMAGMGGEKALTELKKILPLSTKYMIMTGWEDGTTQQRIEDLGVDAYFPKPIDIEKTLDTVAQLLEIE